MVNTPMKYILLNLAMILICICIACTSDANISTIYTKLDDPSSNAIRVKALIDFEDQNQLDEFPIRLGDWTGNDYDTEKDIWGDLFLEYESILLREYSKTGSPNIVFMCILNATIYEHPLEIWYPATGWEIMEEGFVDISWKDDLKDQHPLSSEFSKRNVTITLKMLLVGQKESGETSERRLVLFCYVKPAKTDTEEYSTTLFRISTSVPNSGTYESFLISEEELIREIIPRLFKPTEKYDERPKGYYKSHISQHGPYEPPTPIPESELYTITFSTTWLIENDQNDEPSDIEVTFPTIWLTDSPELLETEIPAVLRVPIMIFESCNTSDDLDMVTVSFPSDFFTGYPEVDLDEEFTNRFSQKN